MQADAQSAVQQDASDSQNSSNRVQFASLNLDSTVQQGINSLGFEFCSPIQGQILPHTLAGNDAIG
ncbi:MAG: ATP-dependent RNA helicase RhlB, partial [Luminiphilus sp.]